jgi:hypothetical protein
MKSVILGLALSAATVLAAPAALAQNVSISVGQPGFYGALNIGDFAGRPVVYGPRPVIIERGPGYLAEPVYLRVPGPERMHWARYCRRYGACGRPVFFVQDSWYTNTYVPRYREHFGPRYGGPHYGGYHGGPRYDGYRGGPGRHEGWDRGRHEGWEHGRGPGEGRGHGDGRGDGRGEGHGEGHGHR